MNNKIRGCCLATLVFCLLAMVAAHAMEDIDQQRACLHCGMDRKLYGYSRMLVIYQDGSRAGVCSLQCAVTEMNANRNKNIRTLLAADRDSRQLVNADQAVWVMGGGKRGVMTARPKWAFAARENAQKFIDSHGGRIADWQEVLAAAREETK